MIPTDNLEAGAGDLVENWMLIKRGLYWRPNAQGYTGLKSEAGRYSDEEAQAYDEHDGDGTTKMPWADAPDLAPSCSDESARRFYAAQLAAVTAENARLRERIEQAYKAGFDFAMLTNSADADLAAENARLRGLLPELPPYPPEGGGLPRYGLRWNGPDEPLATPMGDGYWTPYHLADQYRRYYYEAGEELSEVAAAIGITRWMDPPDGGDVSLAEQVRRMKADLAEAEAQLKASRAALRHVEEWWLTDGMNHFSGAPYAIFAARAALSQEAPK